MWRVWRKWTLFCRVRDEGAREVCAGAVGVYFTSSVMEGCALRASVEERPAKFEVKGNLVDEGVFMKDEMGRWRNVEPSS